MVWIKRRSGNLRRAIALYLWTRDFTWLNCRLDYFFEYAKFLLILVRFRFTGRTIYGSKPSEQPTRVLKRAILIGNIVSKVIHGENRSLIKGWPLGECLFFYVQIYRGHFLGYQMTLKKLTPLFKVSQELSSHSIWSIYND